jgi:quercetin dioxygenase-like cupin family protein
MDDKSYFYQPDLLAALPEIPPDTIISQTVLENERVKLILFGFAPGQELSEHTASMPAILHFLQGEAAVTLGADEQIAQQGTVVYMQPRLPHSIRAQTPVIMVLLMLKGDLA